MKLLILGANERLHRSIVHACAELAGGASGVRPTFLTGSSSEAVAAAASRSDAAVIVDRSVTPSLRATELATDEQWAIRVARDVGSARLVLACGRAGADRDRTDALQDAARRTFRDLAILRSAPVYGIGDDPVTLFLIMMRSLPVVPVLNASHRMQPIFHEDFARVVAANLTRPPSAHAPSVDIAGPDAITQEELYDRIAALIDRRPARVPVPEFVASYGARLAEALGLPTALEASHLPFAHQPVPLAAAPNVLQETFFFEATPIDQGLRRLIHQLDEVTPAEGIGNLEVKRFFTVINDSKFSATELLREFCLHFADVMPIEVGVEPAAPQKHLTEGAVLTMTLPGRGHVQVRVVVVDTHQAVVATLRGHAVAGIVQFSATPVTGGGVRFQVMPCDTAANAMDWIALTLGGARLQDFNWSKVVQNVVDLSGGRADEIERDARKLTGAEREAAERWIAALVDRPRSRR